MKRLLLIGLFFAGLSVASIVWAQSPTQDQSEQSLGDYARKNKAQQGQSSHPGKVYSNDDVKNPLSISLPDKTWAVEVQAEGFILDTDQSAPGGKRRIMASDEARGITISVQLEQVNHEPTLDECRQSQRDRVKAFTGKLEMRDIKYWDDGKMAFVEYLVPEYQGKPVRQNNLFACFSKEDVFVDIHISKKLFEPKDEVMLSATMGTVYVANQKAGTASGSGSDSMDLFRKGSLLYNQRHLREAIEPYQKALDLEKKDPKLEKNF